MQAFLESLIAMAQKEIIFVHWLQRNNKIQAMDVRYVIFIFVLLPVQSDKNIIVIFPAILLPNYDNPVLDGYWTYISKLSQPTATF